MNPSRTLGPDTLVVRSADAPTAAVDDDLVILNQARDHYLGLDSIGRAIWDRLAEPRRVDDLCLDLVGAFRGEPDVIAADARGFLEELVEEGLVRVVAP